MTISGLLSPVHDFIWGLLVDWILYVGIFLSLGLNLVTIRQIPFAVSKALSSLRRSTEEDGISAFAALMTSAGGNIGTGSLAGMALMLSSGGPGSLLWMWLATLLNLATKYGEALLAVRYSTHNDRGQLVAGPMYYIHAGLGPSFRWMASLFAVMGSICTFGLGNGVQSVELANSLELIVGLPTLVSGLLVGGCCLWILQGGIRRVSAISMVIVPLMVASYLAITGFLLIEHLDSIPEVLRTIVTDAFNPRSVASGSLFVVVSAGVRRAVFAQEIGMGTTPIVNGVARPQDAVMQGMVATLSSLMTALVGTMTGLLLLCSETKLANHDETTMLYRAFESSLQGTSALTHIFTVLFTFTTIIVFGYYGERCVEYLFGSRSNIPFRLIWCSILTLSSITEKRAIWLITDILNALMALPNIVALVMLSGCIFALTKKYRFSRG